MPGVPVYLQTKTLFDGIVVVVVVVVVSTVSVLKALRMATIASMISSSVGGVSSDSSVASDDSLESVWPVEDAGASVPVDALPVVLSVELDGSFEEFCELAVVGACESVVGIVIVVVGLGVDGGASGVVGGSVAGVVGGSVAVGGGSVGASVTSTVVVDSSPSSWIAQAGVPRTTPAASATAVATRSFMT